MNFPPMKHQVVLFQWFLWYFLEAALGLRQVVLPGTDWSRFAASDRHFGGWCSRGSMLCGKCIAGVKKTSISLSYKILQQGGSNMGKFDSRGQNIHASRYFTMTKLPRLTLMQWNVQIWWLLASHIMPQTTPKKIPRSSEDDPFFSKWSLFRGHSCIHSFLHSFLPSFIFGGVDKMVLCAWDFFHTFFSLKKVAFFRGDGFYPAFGGNAVFFGRKNGIITGPYRGYRRYPLQQELLFSCGRCLFGRYGRWATKKTRLLFHPHITG